MKKGTTMIKRTARSVKVANKIMEAMRTLELRVTVSTSPRGWRNSGGEIFGSCLVAQVRGSKVQADVDGTFAWCSRVDDDAYLIIEGEEPR